MEERLAEGYCMSRSTLLPTPFIFPVCSDLKGKYDQFITFCLINLLPGKTTLKQKWRLIFKKYQTPFFLGGILL
jgi:hypothetical protein